jgi:hypothetical protein
MDNLPQLAVSTDNIFISVPADGFVENLMHLESFGKQKILPENTVVIERSSVCLFMYHSWMSHPKTTKLRVVYNQ